jgi:membrane protein required for colicin V production
MTVVDYAVLAIVALSVLISVWRGAAREILALGAWVLAFLAAQAYAAPVAAYLPLSIESRPCDCLPDSPAFSCSFCC